MELSLSLDEGNAAGKRVFMKNNNTGSLENSFKTVMQNVTAGENPVFKGIIFFSVKVIHQIKIRLKSFILQKSKKITEIQSKTWEILWSVLPDHYINNEVFF